MLTELDIIIIIIIIIIIVIIYPEFFTLTRISYC